ncbi:hypothetical protein JP74_02930 [Devosia sp. 17-2-E-8]|nr:hypothetical protein JP74_02930 [Devosia sp. 17-2-E-8]
MYAEIEEAFAARANQAAIDVIDTLVESLNEGLMTDAGLTKADISAMKHQVEALNIAKDEILALPAPALSRAEGQEPVAVKPLEWTGPDVNGDRHARSILAVYTIRKQQGSMGFWLTEVGGYHSSIDKAKAAAQADYEQRIRSALVKAPAPAVPDGWKPIETAPKDGRNILLWVVHSNSRFSASPVEEGWQAPAVGHWTDFNSGGWVHHGLAGQPTMWADILPAPSRPLVRGEGE